MAGCGQSVASASSNLEESVVPPFSRGEPVAVDALQRTKMAQIITAFIFIAFSLTSVIMARAVFADGNDNDFHYTRIENMAK